VCAALCALICRGGRLEDQLLVQHAEAICDEGQAARHALPAATAEGFVPRGALDDVIRTAERAGL
jgi:hypothetical protein